MKIAILTSALLLFMAGCEQKSDPAVPQSIRIVTPFTYVVMNDGDTIWQCIVDELKPLDTFRIGGGRNQLATTFTGNCTRYTKEPQ